MLNVKNKVNVLNHKNLWLKLLYRCDFMVFYNTLWLKC